MAHRLPRPFSAAALAAAAAASFGGLTVAAAADAAPRATTLSGVVWSDASGDGLRQASESGAAGIHVTVERRVKVRGKVKYTKVASRTTAASGSWSVKISRQAAYRVRVERPTSFRAVSPRGPAAAKGVARSSVSLAGRSRVLTIRPAGKTVRIDAGLIPASPTATTAPTTAPISSPEAPAEATTPTTPQQPTSDTTNASPAPKSPAPVETPVVLTKPFEITGIGWKDEDADGIRDASEPRIAGLIVRLYKADGKTELGVTSTNAFGGWTLTVPADTPYRVKYTNNDPKTRGVTRRHRGQNSALDSDISRGVADAYLTEVLPAGTPDSHLDAGFGATTTLGNRVWQDKDHDGVQDAGEPGVGGVTVELYDDLRTQLLATTQSDASGMYNLGGAFYGGAPVRIHVVRPVGATLSPADKGGDDSEDSDVISDSYLGYLNGWTQVFTPSVIETVYQQWDIGLY